MDCPEQDLNFRHWLRDRLRTGRLGEVYRADDVSLNRLGSVKPLGAAWKDAMNPEQRFLHEAGVISRLSHPNIVEEYECRNEQGKLFSMMEPLEGRDLRSLLAEVTTLPLSQVLEIVRAIGAALQHAHNVGIVHQDINPSNIFLSRPRSYTETPVEVVKVMNFGLAKQLTRDSAGEELALHHSFVFGPPTYLSPEALVLRGEEVDARSDQWSLAVLAYQMLTGQLSFWDSDSWWLRELIRGAAEPAPLAQLMPELPACVLGAIQKALSKDKDKRYPTIGDFIRALDGLPGVAGKQTRLDLRAVQNPLVHETLTWSYPVLSLPAELLASADGELQLELEPGPKPAPEPLKVPGKTSNRPPGTGRRVGLIGCIVMALAPAPVVASLHYLHLSFPSRAPAHMSALSPTQPPPGIVASPSPNALNPQPLLAPSRPMPDTMARKYKGPRSHHHRRLVKDSQRQAQAALTEGLGL